MGLIAGEKLTFSSDEDALAAWSSDEKVNEKYIQGEVRIVTEQARYPLSTIAAMVESDDYDLNPEFQRRHRWDVAKQSRLIESIIMNVPIPPVFLYEDRYSHYEVMDGLQRLTAIAEFYRDRYQLKNLGEWGELNGRSYSELPEQLRRGVDRRYLSSIILLHETARDEKEALRLKQLVFERINSGGVKLEPQESRNAIYNGPLNQLCIELARNPHLCHMWDIPAPGDEGPEEKDLLANERYRKMLDVELVLRFFAHRQREDLMTGSLAEYLDDYLKHGNLFSESVLNELSDLFQKTVALVHETLGYRAFWLWRYRHGHWDWLQRPTTVAYDALMHVFSERLHVEHELRLKSETFQSEIKGFYEEHEKSFEARYTNRANLRERDRLFGEFVDGVLAS